jgi:uncharacterized protein YukE
VVDLALEGRAAIRARAGVLRAADDLRAERARVAARVQSLVRAGWAGVAAEQYAAGWDDWCAGADGLEQALSTLGDLMGGFRAALETTDRGSAEGSHLLVSRLGEVP